MKKGYIVAVISLLYSLDFIPLFASSKISTAQDLAEAKKLGGG